MTARPVKTKLAVIAATLLALTSCSGNITKGDGGQSVMSEQTYTLNDGRQVICIVGVGRLSCDWEHAK